MFDKRTLGDMRRSGMNIGLSKAKLSQAMLEILIQLPAGTTNLKQTIINNMGLMGQISATRDINEAWNKTKKKAAKEYPDKFLLDGRGLLQWNDCSVKLLDKKISAVNYKKLNEMADVENYSVNQMVSKLIKSYGNKNA